MKIEIEVPKVSGYVIYNPNKKAFSTGGSDPKWKSHGKIWKNIGHVKNHLQQFIHCNYQKERKFGFRDTYQYCVVVDISTNETIDFGIYEYMMEYSQRNTYTKNGEFLGILPHSELQKKLSRY